MSRELWSDAGARGSREFEGRSSLPTWYYGIAVRVRLAEAPIPCSNCERRLRDGRQDVPMTTVLHLREEANARIE
ncbi:MAG: hypothetical protein JW751_22750 [Polyangiaceae bacterium]|nr:hypothetical protein [Polyangiaceae bacterium]